MKEIKKNEYDKILKSIVEHIESSKLRAFSEVNKALIEAYWNIGKELSKKAGYGKSVVEKLSQDLKWKYPKTKGFSVTNLWNMKRFYETYQKLQPVAGELKNNRQKLQTVSGELLFQISWSNHVMILDKTHSDEEKQFYLKMCINERWAKRELKRQIDSSLFERYVLSQGSKKVLSMIPKNKPKEIITHFKDDYILEFLNLKKDYSEKELENAILNNLKDFFLEFGKALTFLGSQYVIEVDGKENRIDLLFFHRRLRCLVAVELKSNEFKASYVGQMQKYLAALDEKIRLPDERESIGLILCQGKGKEEVNFTLSKTTSPIKVATYQTQMPDKKIIIKLLEQLNERGCKNRNKIE